jgi:hypothetical protein
LSVSRQRWRRWQTPSFFYLLKAISSWSAHVRARIARCGFTIGPKLTIGVGAVWLSAAIAQK